MLAAVLHDFDKLVLEEVSCPTVSNIGDVLVQIKSCGFCATDYKAIRGIRRNVNFPFIAGHEPSGVIVSRKAIKSSASRQDIVVFATIAGLETRIIVNMLLPPVGMVRKMFGQELSLNLC